MQSMSLDTSVISRNSLIRKGEINMNNFTTAIASFIRFDNAVINTLEYTMKKDSYDIKAYEWRKGLITSDISNPTPLKNCLDNSGEAGEKLLGMIKSLLSLVYSDESTIAKLGADGTELRIDAAQHLAVFEAVLPIHFEMRNVINSFIIQAKKEEKFDEPSFEKLLESEEYFFTGLSNLLLIDEFDHLFAEYNKARNEAKGAITPQSNFIQNDLANVSKTFATIRQHSPLRSADYYELIDPVFALIEMSQGRRDLPAGKSFGDVFTEMKKLSREKTVKWENVFKPLFQDFNVKFDEEVKRLQALAKDGKATIGEDAKA